MPGACCSAVGRRHPTLVCLCYLAPDASRQARRLLQRMRGRVGTMPACVLLWGIDGPAAGIASKLSGADAVVGSLSDATSALIRLLPAAAPPPAVVSETADA